MAGPLRCCEFAVLGTAGLWSQSLASCVWVDGRPPGPALPLHFAPPPGPLSAPAGGYAVLKGVQQGMGLPAHTMVPCFAALRDYGNTSGSTTWYVMAYLETCADVRRGHKVLQVRAQAHKHAAQRSATRSTQHTARSGREGWWVTEQPGTILRLLFSGHEMQGVSGG